MLYITIIFSILCMGILSSLFIRYRKRAETTILKQHNTIALLKMQTIRNRLSPHFFFNVLSGISAESDLPDHIKKNLTTLMILCRKSIDHIEQIAVSVEDEIELVKGYIELQRWRIPEPFKIIWEIEETTDLNHLIPAMLIQIPVENAIKHALLPLTGEKLLRIKIRKYETCLKIIIEDNGIGYQQSANRALGTGTGLKILYQMIYLLNKQNTEKIEFSIIDKRKGDASATGTIVEIKIPKNYSFDIKINSF